MGDLSLAVIGTQIKIPNEFGRSFMIKKVTSVSPANVICGDTKLRKSDGFVSGSGAGWSRRFANIATDADIIENRIACAKDRLQMIKVSEKNIEVIERQIAESGGYRDAD